MDDVVIMNDVKAGLHVVDPKGKSIEGLNASVVVENFGQDVNEVKMFEKGHVFENEVVVDDVFDDGQNDDHVENHDGSLDENLVVDHVVKVDKEVDNVAYVAVNDINIF